MCATNKQTMTAKARMVSSLVPNHRLSQAGAQVKLHAQPNIHPLFTGVAHQSCR